MKIKLRGFKPEPHPPEPKGQDKVWYRGWEAGFDLDLSDWFHEPYVAFFGGCDLDAPQLSAKTWAELLDEIDEEELA